jgi:hypothetical protein
MKKSGLRFASSELNKPRWMGRLTSYGGFESGPVKAGAIRKITIPDSRYTMAYRITKNFKRVSVLSIRGAQKPIKW